MSIGELIAKNDESRARLAALVQSLDGDDYTREIGAGWNVAAALAHMAFWDRLVIGWIDFWESRSPDYAGGFREWEQAVRAAAAKRTQPLNDEMLPGWLQASGPQAASECLAAADAADGRVAAMSPDLAEAALTANLLGVSRPWAIDRATHRADHCGAIERALAARVQVR